MAGPATYRRILLSATAVLGGVFATAAPVHADTSCQLGRDATRVGTDGSDIIRGTPGRDLIDAKGGNDVIYGRGGNDMICGGPGSDRIYGGGGPDLINAGYGRDVVIGGSGSDRINGWNGRDRIRGNGGADDIALTPKDRINGGRGRDALRASFRGRYVVDLKKGTASGGTTLTRIENVYGGPGDNVFKGDAKRNVLSSGGTSRLIGRGGDDIIRPGTWWYPQEINGGGGFDLVDYSILDPENSTDIDLLSGYAHIQSPSGAGRRDDLKRVEAVVGSRGDDVISGTDGRNELNGLAGNDLIYGFGGPDRLGGDDGDDVLAGGYGSDEVDGGAGEDLIQFSKRTATGVVVDLSEGFSSGGGGSDTLFSVEHALGTRFADFFYGDDAVNAFDGDAGNDTFFGRGGDDNIFGGQGDDVMHGEAGDDHLDGYYDADEAYGGDGYDHCVNAEVIDACETTTDP